MGIPCLTSQRYLAWCSKFPAIVPLEIVEGLLLGACATGDIGLEGERALQPTSAAWWGRAGPISADQHIPELA